MKFLAAAALLLIACTVQVQAFAPRALGGISRGRTRVFGKVSDVSAEEFERTIAEGGAAVVDVYARWCGPCQVLAPELEKVAEKMGERITFMKMDSDVEQDIASRLEVYALPTLLLYKDGELVKRLEGAFPAKILEQELESVFS